MNTFKIDYNNFINCQKWTQEDTEHLNKKYLCDKGEKKKKKQNSQTWDLAQGRKVIINT